MKGVEGEPSKRSKREKDKVWDNPLIQQLFHRIPLEYTMSQVLEKQDMEGLSVNAMLALASSAGLVEPLDNTSSSSHDGNGPEGIIAHRPNPEAISTPPSDNNNVTKRSQQRSATSGKTSTTVSAQLAAAAQAGDSKNNSHMTSLSILFVGEKEEVLKDALMKSLAEQMAELSPEQRLVLQKKILAQKIRERRERTQHLAREILNRRKRNGNSGVDTSGKDKFGGGSGRSVQQNALVPVEGTVLHACDQCGKVYKHRSCLVKHRWEHHSAWEETKRCCTTKHQQVQMLEAAQLLAELTEKEKRDGGAAMP